MAGLLAEAKAFVVTPPAVDEEARAAVAAKVYAERREAYEQLELWYKDWAQLFRGELPYHQLLRLGLTHRPAAKAEEEPEAPTPTTPTTTSQPR